MGVRTGWMAVAVLAVALGATARMTGQAPQPPAQPPVEGHGGPPPPGAQAPAPPPGQGQRRDLPRFPAHQRPPADPAVVERGRGLYAGNCGPCHGVDARGGQLGGPNLLRSQLVLADRDGELIVPVVHQGRPGTIMVPRPDLPEADVKAMATYLHHLQAQGSNQGGPPPGEEVPLDILVGDAPAGAAYFAKQCASCHSASGDLQGIATRVPEAMALQNLWVSGGRAAGRRQFRPPSQRSTVKATIALPSGEKVEGALVRIDDFSVTVRLADETQRTFRRTGDVPAVTLVDPLEGHQQLLLALSNADMHDVTAYLATLK
jgi:cytochrome c oxidase cbb3-type subunit 3